MFSVWGTSQVPATQLSQSVSSVGGDAEGERDQLTHAQTYKSRPFTTLAGALCAAADHTTSNSDID